MRRQIPNLFTLCNLLCGILGIVVLMEGSNVPVAYFIWVACLFDFLDGFAARLLRVTSPFGKELDSLADMVTFGVVPGLVMYQLLKTEFPAHGIAFIAFLLIACSALRLARFNLDSNQSVGFKGLPTPANALFITALPFIHAADLRLPGEILLALTLLFSYLMISPLRLFALKFTSFKWRENRYRFTFLFFTVLLLGLLGKLALPLIIILYIAISLGIKNAD